MNRIVFLILSGLAIGVIAIGGFMYLRQFNGTNQPVSFNAQNIDSTVIVAVAGNYPVLGQVTEFSYPVRTVKLTPKPAPVKPQRQTQPQIKDVAVVTNSDLSTNTGSLVNLDWFTL